MYIESYPFCCLTLMKLNLILHVMEWTKMNWIELNSLALNYRSYIYITWRSNSHKGSINVLRRVDTWQEHIGLSTWQAIFHFIELMRRFQAGKSRVWRILSFERSQRHTHGDGGCCCIAFLKLSGPKFKFWMS